MLPIKAMQVRSAPSGPPAIPGQPPSTYAGLTFWLSGDSSPLYTRTTPPTGSNVLTTANNALASRIDSAGSISRSLARGDSPSTMTAFRHKNPLSGLSARGYSSKTDDPDAELNDVCVFTKPSGTNNPSTLQTIGSLWTASTKVAVCAIKVNAAAPENLTEWLQYYVVGDSLYYTGLMFYKSGGNVVFRAYSYSGGAVVKAEAAHPLGSWVTVAMRHSSGQLRIRINDGAWVSATCGNTDNVTGSAVVGGYHLTGTDFEIAELATYNAARSDAEIIEVQRWMGAKVGITIP